MRRGTKYFQALPPPTQKMPSDDRWLGALAVLCEAITADPDAALTKQEGNAPLIKQLQRVAADATSAARKSRAWLSQCAVFLDVLPAYRVRLASHKEKEQAQTRETQKLRLKEEWLVKAYGEFVASLSRAARREEPQLVACAIRCSGELYARRPQFNLSEDVLKVAVLGLDHVHDEVRANAARALKRAMADDRSGQACLAVARAVNGLLRDRKGGLRRADALHLLADLDAPTALDDEAFLEKNRLRKLVTKKQPAKAQKKVKSKTRRARDDEVQAAKDLKATAAHTDARDTRRAQRALVHELGLIYGRVVQSAFRGDGRMRRILLPAALRGLKKLAPACNADVLDAALAQNRGIARDETCEPETALCCADAALELCDATKDALDLDDDGAFVDGVFRALLAAAIDGKLDREALECVLRTSTERSRLETGRAAAVLRRALLVSLNRFNGSAFVAAARKILARDAVLECLLEDDEDRGPFSAGAPYNAAAVSAASASALGAPAWELVLLARHVDGRVAAQAKAMLAGTRPGAGDDPRGLALATIVPELRERVHAKKKRKKR